MRDTGPLRSPMKQIGDWHYKWMIYHTKIGSPPVKDLRIIHKEKHWVGPAHLEKGKCICGAKIPGVILLHRAMVKAGWK